jgi:hypothetical protein
LRIGGRWILTADHCAAGSDHEILVDGESHPATVWVRTDDSAVDLALLLAEGLDVSSHLKFGQIVSQNVVHLRDCSALGFPVWKSSLGQPAMAQASGYVPTAEGTLPDGTAPIATFKITDPEARAQETAVGLLEGPSSLWAGMSGAVVVDEFDIVVGVIRSHNLIEGPNSLSITPLSAISTRDPAVRDLFLEAFELISCDQLIPLPYDPSDETTARLRRVKELEQTDLIHHEAAIKLHVHIVLVEFGLK